MNTAKQRMSTRTMVLGAVLTALVVVLQMMGSFIRFGPFSISLVLIPIVVGAAMCGVGVRGFLGFVFGIVVLMTDAGAFLAISVPGTIITVLVKGIACGIAAGIAYNLVAKYNRYAAVVAAAMVCPIVNTGIFLLGGAIFFLDALREWGASAGFTNVVSYMFLGIVGGNFIFEFISNMILSPVIVRILNIGKKV
ncbi:MAG: ECF transporter S component [Clostridia bacterium]|nr:ECF transporter S component [Clostridia bacterium]